ncbi:MAG TPA: hypothetical protein ENG11_05360 [candidate division Zixibacteria bacterium]|nr:hypothetical protein [candidate division Zixibacteria bacterium]
MVEIAQKKVFLREFYRLKNKTCLARYKFFKQIKAANQDGSEYFRLRKRRRHADEGEICGGEVSFRNLLPCSWNGEQFFKTVLATCEACSPADSRLLRKPFRPGENYGVF